MSRKVLESQLSDARSQLAEAQRELELSTFLNKGVLQSNSEFKLRIAELEQENAVLRIAESRLARTEDKAELAERRAKELVAELREKETEWAERGRVETETREGLEVEIESLREEVRSWREVGERVGGLMSRSSTRGDRSVRRNGNAAAGPSRPTQSLRSTPVLAQPSRSAPKPELSSARQRIGSPIVLAPSARGQKRRRRIEDSGDDTQDEGADKYAPASPVPDRTPTRPSRNTTTRTARANSTSGKKRDAQPQRKGDSGQRRRTSPVPAPTTVKVEAQSPTRESEESEDDPLYLE